MTSGGGARLTAFQEVRPGAGFQTGDFYEEMLGGLPQNDSIPRAVLFPRREGRGWRQRSVRTRASAVGPCGWEGVPQATRTCAVEGYSSAHLKMRNRNAAPGWTSSLRNGVRVPH